MRRHFPTVLPAAMAAAACLMSAGPLAAQTGAPPAAPDAQPQAPDTRPQAPGAQPDAPGAGRAMGRGHGCTMRGHPMGRITVTGEGESHVAPDMAIITLGVTTQATTAAEAMSANSEQQARVIEALGAQGIAPRDVQTSGLNLSPLMTYPEGQPPRVTGYQAQNMVSVRVRDLPALGSMLDGIVGAGANEMNGISFQRDDPQPAEDAARGEAVADARHNAQVLAEAAGLGLGPVLAIRDSPQGGGGPQPLMMARDAAGAESVPIQAGELAIRALVEVDYALVSDSRGGRCGPPKGTDPGGPAAHGMGDGAGAREGGREGDRAGDGTKRNATQASGPAPAPPMTGPETGPVDEPAAAPMPDADGGPQSSPAAEAPTVPDPDATPVQPAPAEPAPVPPAPAETAPAAPAD